MNQPSVERHKDNSAKSYFISTHQLLTVLRLKIAAGTSRCASVVDTTLFMFLHPKIRVANTAANWNPKNPELEHDVEKL